MKKLIVILGTLLACSGCFTVKSKYYVKTVPSPARFYSEVAVIPENWDSYWISSFSHRALITELMDAGFVVIERSNIEMTVKEKQSDTKGKVKTDDDGTTYFEFHTLDKTSISELGVKLGVKHLILVYVVPTGRKVHMGTIRLVDVATAKVITSTTFIAPFKGEDAAIVMRQVALDIVDVLRSKAKIIRNSLSLGSIMPDRQKKDRLEKN